MINRIFIMLGNSCNISCRYCMQHSLVNRNLNKEVSPSVLDYIRHNVEINKDITITFYGGEPLIYFPTIKFIMSEIPELKGHIGIISNGKALTDEIVEYLNEWEARYTLSWDGRNVMKTRGIDVINIPEIKHRLLRINKLSLSAVLSAYNYPLDIIDAFASFDTLYFGIHKHHIGINIDNIFNVGNMDKDLLNIDYARIKKEIKILFSGFFDAITDSLSWLKFAYIRNLLYRGNQKKNTDKNRCGNGYSVINIDLEGNLYGCHNTSKIAGNIHGDMWEYTKNIKEEDCTEKRRKERCVTCEAFPICDGGCKLIPEKNLEEYCKLRKAVFGTLLQEVKKIKI